VELEGWIPAYLSIGGSETTLILLWPSRPAIVAYDIKFIGEKSRFEARLADYSNSSLGWVAVDVERKVQTRGQDYFLNFPGLLRFNPCHECVLVHPLIENLLTAISERISGAAPDAS
jgi:hypothetical protein